MSQIVRSSADLYDTIREHREEIRGYGLARMGIFGSFARDRAEPESDVDVLISFAPGQKSFDKFVALAEFLEDLFGRRVELVTFDALSAHNRNRILEEIRYVDVTD